jgi:hypothetical protein
MTADRWHEDAQGIWQSQESVVTRMTGDDMRRRAARWHTAFGRTAWIPFACAAFFLGFFVLMLVVNGDTALKRVGAFVGIVAAGYLCAVGVEMRGRRWDIEGATCIQAYKMQLERRRRADVASARTILLTMSAAALLTDAAGWGPWSLQAAGQLGAGIVAYVYVMRQARRFRMRINELTRLQAD